MAEHKLFPGETPHVSTLLFHTGRPRAPHLEQPDHRPRLLRTAELIRDLRPASVVDLGCGDGGLLTLLRDLDAWGYDFSLVNEPAWDEREVNAAVLDVFNQRHVPHWGQLAVCTEVLEHLADPHGTVEWIAHHAVYLVASSPHNETPEHHSDCHAWAWNHEGYRALIEPHFEILTHDTIDWSQIITGRSRYQ
jgi:hypothetical protein